MEKNLNFYEELEVSKNASHETIRAAYKSLIQRYHPDKNEGKNHERLASITAAYKVLSNPELRAIYDKEVLGEAEQKWSKAPKGGGAPEKEELRSKLAHENINQKDKSPQIKIPKVQWFMLVAFLSLISFAVYVGVEKRKEKQKADLEAWKKLEEVRIEKANQEKLKDGMLWEQEINQRTTKLFSGYKNIELNKARDASCAVQGGDFTLPTVRIIIGRIDWKKIKASYDLAEGVIKYKIEENLKTLTKCDLLQVNIESEIENSIKDAANKVLFGDNSFYPKCDRVMRLPDGSLSYDDGEYGIYEYADVCRGIEKVTLEAPIRVR